MKARFEVPAALGLARAYGRTHPETWGGMWLTYPAASTIEDVLQVNVGTTDDVAALRRTITDLIPGNVHLVVQQVANRQADLDAIVDQLALRGTDFFARVGTTYYGAGTTIKDNIVEIDVSAVTPEVNSAVAQEFGAGAVRVVAGLPAVADVCNSRVDCGPPWAGGMWIASAAGACTAGFGISYYNGIWSYGMFTAGHCGGGTWHEGTLNGTVIGTSSQVHFGNNLPADVQVIPIASTAHYNKYADGATDCSPCTLRAITVTQGHDADGAGDGVCNHGAASGTQCGSIAQTNYSFPWTEKGVTLIHQRRATYTRNAGDSGGPVTSAANTAVGSHTHYKDIGGVRYAVYSHIWEMENLTGWDVSHS